MKKGQKGRKVKFYAFSVRKQAQQGLYLLPSLSWHPSLYLLPHFC